jgi:hypothetical protein
LWQVISSDQEAINAYQSKTDAALKVKNGALLSVSTLSEKIADLESKSIPQKSSAVDQKILTIALGEFATNMNAFCCDFHVSVSLMIS